MTWYKNYLAAEVQPWARQVQKEIDNLKSNFQSAEVNNTTRDDQLASSLRQVQNAATQASEAAIAAADAAQEASNANATAISANNTAISANATAISANNTAISANSTAITANSNAISALQDIVDLGSSGGPTVSADNLTAGTITAVDINGVNIAGVSITASDFTSGGIVDVSEVNTGICTVSQDLRALTNTFVAGNTTTSFNGNLFINSSGIMFRNPTISSQEAKENIAPISIDSDAFIAINPVTFNYKREAVRTDEEAEASNLGFILEDFEAAGFGEFLTVPTNEIDQYKGLRYDKLYMFLHKVVQEQHQKIQELEARITTLEG